MPLPIAPVSPLGTEFRIPDLPEARPAQPARGFGDMLAEQVGKLAEQQQEGAAQAQALATGQAEDVASVVMAVERASLGLQLATQVRNKAVDAYHEIFRMQV